MAKKPVSPQLGWRLSELRQQRGLTRRDVAAAIRVTSQAGLAISGNSAHMARMGDQLLTVGAWVFGVVVPLTIVLLVAVWFAL
jgi:hypothetical protein